VAKRSSNQQTSLGRTLFQGIVAIIVVILGLIFAGQGNAPAPSGGTGPGNTTSNGLPPTSFKQKATVETFDGCPPEGDGGDPALNLNKNRIDDGNYQQVAFSALMPPNLTWPKETERTDHADWSQAAADQVAQAEGLPVSVVGYVALARREGPETPNCHSTTDVDFHIWIIDHPGGSSDRIGSIVVEATPRVRVNHPGWTVGALNNLAQNGTQVLISGWLMLDPEHPDQVGQTRGTIWEIHPVMRIDVAQNGQWVPLDNFSG
jgi:hypothetical protein